MAKDPTTMKARYSNLTLYHGTLASLVPSIMTKGLEPRSASRPSHDAYMDSASMVGFSYFTVHYGNALEHACRISQRTKDAPAVAVLSVGMASLKPKLRYPDEDYLKEEWNSDFTDWMLKEQLRYMKSHQDDWWESIDLLGTLAYKGVITPEAITVCHVPRWLEQEKRRKFPYREMVGVTR